MIRSARRVDAARGRRLRAEALQDARRLRVARRLLDVGGDVRRHELAAVREHRVEARHLERRHQQIALADRQLDRVAGLPDTVDRGVRRAGEVLAPPLRRRHEAGHLTLDVDAGRRAEAEARSPVLERMPAARRQVVEREADLVEVGVARLGERRLQVDPLVHVRVPVLEDLILARLPLDRVVRRAEQRRSTV